MMRNLIGGLTDKITKKPDPVEEEDDYPTFR